MPLKIRVASALIFIYFYHQVSSRKEVSTHTHPRDEAAKSSNEPSSFINKKDTYSQNTHEQVPVTHYTHFKNYIKAFKGENKQELVSRLYGIYLVQSLRLLKFSIHEEKRELFEILSIQALTIRFQSTKRKTTVIYSVIMTVCYVD